MSPVLTLAVPVTLAIPARSVGASALAGLLFYMTMSDRKERREIQRQVSKDYDALALEIREHLDDLPDGDFKSAVLNGLEVLDRDAHPNNALAAHLILGCLANVKAGRDDMGRLMLYMSGAIVNDVICRSTLGRLFA